MAVSRSSRYYGLPVYPTTDALGDTHPTIGMRPSAPPDVRTLRYYHRLIAMEDMEMLAWRFYGDSRQWWRVAEANGLRFPLDTAPGMSLAVPPNDAAVQVVRDRRF